MTQHQTASEWFMQQSPTNRKRIIAALFDQATHVNESRRIFEDFMRRVDDDHHYIKEINGDKPSQFPSTPLPPPSIPRPASDHSGSWIGRTLRRFLCRGLQCNCQANNRR